LTLNTDDLTISTIFDFTPIVSIVGVSSQPSQFVYCGSTSYLSYNCYNNHWTMTLANQGPATQSQLSATVGPFFDTTPAQYPLTFTSTLGTVGTTVTGGAFPAGDGYDADGNYVINFTGISYNKTIDAFSVAPGASWTISVDGLQGCNGGGINVVSAVGTASASFGIIPDNTSYCPMA
jgi:hypothetical protein